MSISSLRLAYVRRGYRFPDIGPFLLKSVIATVYATAVLPFTVRFFQRFVDPLYGFVAGATASSQTEMALLGRISLGELHALFLPLLVLVLELLSVSMAIAFWRPNSRSERLKQLALVLCCQLIPIISVYYAARMTEFQDIVSKNKLIRVVNPVKLSAAQQAQERADKDYETRLAIYQAELRNWTDKRTSMERQVADVVGLISRMDAQISNALREAGNPTTIAVREGARVLIDRLTTDKSQSHRDLSVAQARLADLIAAAPTAPTAPERVMLPELEPAPLPYESDTQFIIKTMGSINSFFGVVAALIFPIIVLGAGNRLASLRGSAPGSENVPVRPSLDLAHEFAFCENLSPARQDAYVTQLESMITFHVASSRSIRSLVVASTSYALESEKEEEELRDLEQIKVNVAASSLALDPKKRLLDRIDRLILGT